MVFLSSSFLFLIVTFVHADSRTTINGTGAVVGSSLFTVQDAQFFDSVSRFMANDAQPVRFEKGESLKRIVQRLILEEMLIRELKQLQIQGVSTESVQKEIAQKTQGNRLLLWRELLKAFGRSQADATAVVWRTQNAERFMRQKVETLSPVVTDAEIQRYYDENFSKTGGNLEAVRPTIVAALRKQQTQKGLEEWIQSLREKHGALSLLQ